MHDFKNAKPVPQAWGLYWTDIPCESYAVKDGKTVSGDDTTPEEFRKHLRAGCTFLTYEADLDQAPIKKAARHYGIAYSCRPLPTGAFFYVGEQLYVVQ